MSDLAAILILAMLAFCAVAGIVGIVCCLAQCIRHCKQIWKFHRKG